MHTHGQSMINRNVVVKEISICILLQINICSIIGYVIIFIARYNRSRISRCRCGIVYFFSVLFSNFDEIFKWFSKRNKNSVFASTSNSANQQTLINWSINDSSATPADQTSRFYIPRSPKSQICSSFLLTIWWNFFWLFSSSKFFRELCRLSPITVLLVA